MKCQFLVLLLIVRAAAQSPLSGTAPLTDQSDLAAEMVDGINDYLLRATEASISKRESFWNRNYASPAAYDLSVTKNRERFRKIIGAVDTRVPVTSLVLQETTSTKALVASGQHYKIYAVRWPVLDGMNAEGLLLQPDSAPVARMVAVPDADWSPEILAGIASGVN